MLRDGGRTRKHMELYAEISREPHLSYDELASRLKRTVKTIRRLESDLIDGGYIEVSYLRLPKGKAQIQRVIVNQHPLEIAS
jgi:predicted transcriptional regulator